MRDNNFFENFKEGQKLFGEDIGMIVNTVLLTIVYIIGVGLTSITAKVFRKKFLELYPDKLSKTYWNNLNLKTQKKETYYRQF